MGIGVENCGVKGHTQYGGSSNDFHFHVHFANQQIDDECPTALTQSDHASLVSAAKTSQSSFDSTAGSLMGSWYNNLGGNFKAGFKDYFSRFP